MAKRVFFSFHYQDVIDFRANTVRNHWLTKKDREVAGFFDASIWESAKKTGDTAVKRLINKGISNTSNTCVLVGSNSFERRWVRYEIFKSIYEGNHVFAVHINKIKGKDQKVKAYGNNPFEYLGLEFSKDGKSVKPIEFKIKNWGYARDFDGYKLDKVAPKSYWGNVYKLSKWHKIYCWKTGDGYKNFSKWVK
ncbi:TIR domain-containing protein [Fulvivirgaceae bacterium BMA10]|uniref:TIR domain-containing protein n=1 Tax=Splendidivirga corallicola TaxID=3051826 RepID=A0ABT8KNB5_9BACT|nr:TIR domain-containing protein [Fulvivirgaceae bacterium BMA10]